MVNYFNTLDGPTPPIYAHAVNDAPGVAAANVFLSFFNPANSGKIMLAIQGLVTAYAVGATSVASSLTARWITGASGGTLVTPGDVYPLRSDFPDTAMEIRTGNPTVTGLSIYGSLATFPPPITTGTGGHAAGQATSPTPAGVPFLPGEGFCFRTDSGDTDQRWNIQFTWAEANV